MEAGVFEGRMTNMLADFQTTLCLAVGQRVGLMQLMLDDSTPSTCMELAKRTNLKERYVREWLGHMVAARVVVIEVSDGERKYFLPRSHRSGLRAWCPEIPILIHYVERVESVVDCFKEGGSYGFGYDAFPHYADSWSDYREDNANNSVDQQIKHYKDIGLTDKLEHGARVLDIGSSDGKYLICFANRYPNSTFVGVDLHDLMVQKAITNVAASGLTNVTFQKADACSLPDDVIGSFDLVLAVQCIHNLHDPMKAISECKKALKPDGMLSVIEPYTHSQPEDNVGNMDAATLIGCSLFECLPSSMSQEPHIGFGAGWGMEGFEKTVTATPMSIVVKHKLLTFPASVHYICRNM